MEGGWRFLGLYLLKIKIWGCGSEVPLQNTPDFSGFGLDHGRASSSRRTGGLPGRGLCTSGALDLEFDQRAHASTDLERRKIYTEYY